MSFEGTNTSPHFAAFVRRLVQLHKLIADGRDESDEGEALRDEMDYPWYQMEKSEQDVAGSLSADLYTIGTDRDSPSRDSVPDDLGNEVTKLHEGKRWVDILTFLREHEANLPREDVAYWRGVCWSNLGESYVASEFYSEAASLDVQNTIFDALRMQALVHSKQLDRAMERAKQIVDIEADWRQLLTAGRAFFSKAETVSGTEANALYETAIRLADRGLALAPKIEKTGNEPTDEARPSCLNAHLDRIWSYEQIGQSERAIEACNDALRIDPENSDALILRGWLLRSTQQESASVDFHAGIAKQLSSRPELDIPIATFSAIASS